MPAPCKRPRLDNGDAVVNNRTLLDAVNAIVDVDLTTDDNAPVDLSHHNNSKHVVAVVNGNKENACVVVVDEQTIKSLQEDLRNEETKLMLLRKIHDSQKGGRNDGGPGGKGGSIRGGPTVKTVPNDLRLSSAAQNNHNHQRGGAGVAGSRMAPSSVSVKGGTAPVLLQVPSRALLQQSKQQQQQQSQATSSVAMSRQSGGGGPPHLVMAGTRHLPHEVLSLRKREGSEPPRSTPPSSSSSSFALAQAHVHHQQQQPPPPKLSLTPQQKEQVLAQRQIAAKQALRKQLERTLLQIPPPKPPPPTMNLIPNPASGEFVVLVGLEEAVRAIAKLDPQLIEGGGATEPDKNRSGPLVCSQCSTDFTPLWQADRRNPAKVVCEHCVTSNKKRALKQEHTNRLKNAFVKALQQEQEMEKCLQATQSIELYHDDVTTAASPKVFSKATITGGRLQVVDQVRQQQHHMLAASSSTAHHHLSSSGHSVDHFMLYEGKALASHYQHQQQGSKEGQHPRPKSYDNRGALPFGGRT